jgi:phospholipase C
MAALVTLFSDPQFTGSFVPVEEGDTRFPAEFNDTARSVRVAPGYVAVLYEHANEFGGYGAAVELLEDCPDLSVYGFDRITSYVRVFPVSPPGREGFVWVRASMQGGQVVPGHWERKRADGTTSDTGVAVVLPPTPAPTAPQGGGGVTVRDHRGEPQRLPPGESTGWDGVVRDHRKSAVKHVFVLMLENRSFDHLLGFSGITGTDAETGKRTAIDGLTGSETNPYNGVDYAVVRGAPDRAPHDPSHNFIGTLQQLCGVEAWPYVSGQPYPPITNLGFAAQYAKARPDEPDGSMRCFTPDQVPVLTALASEFAVCDHWFGSMPGPTEPNRFFVHAGTAGHFDVKPTISEYAGAFSSYWSGVEFENGNIFDRLDDADVKWRIYADDSFPNVALLKGVSRTFDVDDFDDFAEDVADNDYDAAYTFIEPSYDPFSEYKAGNSYHPLGSVEAGEVLIKRTYEALRRSPIWDSSLLIITFDEHGGFYDHVAPPAAEPTGSVGRGHGFTFDRLGPRVPTVVVSPLIPKNVIDHRTYEHCTVIATLTRLFDLKTLTRRSAVTSHVKHLATLEVPRTDAPMTLPDPTGGASARVVKTPFEEAVADHPDGPIDGEEAGMITATVASGLAQHLEVTPQAEHPAILARVEAMTTQGEALAYLQEVHVLVHGARERAGIARSATVRTRAHA